MSIGHAPPDISPVAGSDPVEPSPAGDTADTSPALVPVTPSSARRRSVPRWARRTAGPLLLLALWQLASTFGALPADTLAPPSTIATAGARLIGDGTLPAAMGISLQRVAIGLLLGGTVGTALALLSGLSRLGEDLIDASVQMLRTVPWVGLIPLFIIWMGIGEAPKVALIALGTAFHLYLNVYAGIRGVDEQLIEAGGSLGLGRWGLVRHVVLPGALPGFMTGLRYSLATAWLALVFGESINADAGIGFLMNQAREFFRTDVIVVCLVVYAFLGLTADLVVRALERLLLQWRPTFTGQ
ncbi:ABC transporter permease [Streptomyces lavendulae]|uniref:Aliphatic sulfonates transport permease protein SsuC n=1 Tax=Streptomyces lavendulae subsp. lavendulae TaxID=58340 RepID=A0A2K8PN80_STRLA|nr:ABC transporter permease [Streptomyces lavendulae]ATZ28191.1 Putative aliphatic sulfonates transport permease protein SsuC [Streptomyces lavendulae subsp. lavendulae]QUQ58019.1 Putative aliphatic sulfonates transport permease protein SsuC [Streptomyces lavendulae subsp. lavendulae]